MESITELRKLVLHHLKLSGYIQDNNEFNNENATNWEVLKCCIVAGMYPNICHANSYCDTFDSEKSPNMKIDWSSVVHDRDLNSIGTEWLTYGQKKRIGNNIYVGNLTIVPIIDLIFFAGSLNATISDDGTSFEIDKFIQCIVDKRDGPLLNNIRKKLNVIFNKFLKNEVLSINEKSILETVVDTVKKEDTIEKYIDREISMH
ncbi:3'-5' RNA helicase YTHDC2-like [Contarinia nasturtii]|uniref:3'-5' RNA helicase YTHDC2-like n=1 Tax=Contarinia nasturtii TaxID=265458 RepID=UPI0012D3993E|nr:3'-5' RNA helicase YTHDC2-like [Contarinia nasturtii]